MALSSYVAGGWALAGHGHPRYIGGIDLRIRPTSDKLDRLLAALDDPCCVSLGPG